MDPKPITSDVKFIVTAGGVISGIGKGIVTSSTGLLMQSCGFNMTAIKIDPYLNIDSGTFSPFEHGETFVLSDGGECDLDLGNYERFMNISLTRDNNITTGKIYQKVLAKERKGDYLGKTVQVVPHVTNCIQDWILDVAQRKIEGKAPDICLIELGGTVGDIESMPFIEALRQLRFRIRPENFCILYVSYVPVLGATGEQKTKPTQHGVRDMRSVGLEPDFIFCRGPAPLSPEIRAKTAMFCQVPESNVISVHNVSNLYAVPQLFIEQSVPDMIARRLNLSARLIDVRTCISGWLAVSARVDKLNAAVKSGEITPLKIAIVGKYAELNDAYRSVIAAVEHACLARESAHTLLFVEAEHLEQGHESHDDGWATLRQAGAIVVPGGFGTRGIEGKINAARYAMLNNIPYLGICLGFQVSAIMFVRELLERPLANSEEVDSTVAAADKVVVFMPEIDRESMGGTMRLGAKTSYLTPDSRIAQLYGQTAIQERHRHRYEINPELVPALEGVGVHFVGKDETGMRMEFMEYEHHPYFVGTQAHPEFLSRPSRPAPLFLGLVSHALDNQKKGGSKA